MATPIEFIEQSPGWSATGVEPPPEFKASGYVAGYKPPAGFFNWFWTAVSRCIAEVQAKLAAYTRLNEEEKAAHFGNTGNPHGVTAAQVGAIPTLQKGVNNGVASLDANAKVPVAQLPDGTTSAKGAVQLMDSVVSTSTTRAATPSSVKDAYDLANAALPKGGGTMTGDLTIGTGSGSNTRMINFVSTLIQLFVRADTGAIVCKTPMALFCTTDGSGSTTNTRAPVYASNTTWPSAKKYKTDIADAEKTVYDALLAMRVAEFNYKSERDAGVEQRHCGLIAEEVEALDARYCYYVGGEIEGVNYTHMVAPLIGLCQRQQAAIAALEAGAEELKARVEELERAGE